MPVNHVKYLSKMTTRNFFYLLCLFLSSCHSPKVKEHIVYDGFTQGSTFHIQCYSNQDRAKIVHGIDSIFFLINKTASIYDSNSLISKINSNQAVALNEPLLQLFRISKKISEETDGAFDITVGPLVRAWGFYSGHGINPGKEQIDSIRQYVGYQQIRLQDNQVIKSFPEIFVDFNAIAQGYTVDLVADYFQSNQIPDYLIEIGGELRASGCKEDQKRWIIGIEKPAETDTAYREIRQKIAITDRSLATSGNYRKFFIRDGIKYSHTINPFTGYPVHHSLLSVTVSAPDCTTADALATAFMVMGRTWSKEFIANHRDLDAFFLYSDSLGHIQSDMTDGFRKYLIQPE